jgi:urease accessory protein
MTAAVLTTSGGLAGGDRVAVTAWVGAGARAQVAGQAAEKIYRSTDAAAEMTATLRVAPGGLLEWLPQEMILFDGSRLRRRFDVAVEGDGRLFACDSVVFGRTARGERFNQGLFFDRWTLRRDGGLAWADALRVEGKAELDHKAGFGGAVAAATLLYVAKDAARHLTLARSLVTGVWRAGATIVGEALLIRLFERDAQALRETLCGLVAEFRHGVLGLPARVPRLWRT